MFFQNLVQMGGFELNHHWHGINVLSLLECALLAACLCTMLALFFRFVRKSKRLTALSLVGALSFATAAYAANTALSGLSASGALAGANLIYVVQTVGVGGVKATMTQVATFINSLFSGDATVTSGGVVTVTKTNGTAFGALATVTPGTGVATAAAINVGTAGSVVVNGGALGTPSSGTATNLTGTASGLTAGNVTTNANLTGAVTSTGNATLLGSFSSANLLAALTTKTGTGNVVFGSAPTIDSLNATTAMTLAFLTGSTQCLQVNTSGVVSGTGAVCGGAGSSGANPTATAGPAAVNGSATTFLRSDGAPAVQLGTASQKGIVQVDGASIVATAGVINVNPGCGLINNGTALVGDSTTRNNTTTSDTIVTGDCGRIVTESNASAVAVGIAQAGTTGFATGYYTTVKNKGAGVVTITPTTSTIDGASNLTLSQNQSVDIQSDGANYFTLPGRSSGGGGVSTTGSPANGNLTKFSGANSITNGDLSGDCATSGTLIANCNEPNAGYVANRWYAVHSGGYNFNANAAIANTIECRFGIVPQRVTVKALGVSINSVGTTNLQLAIYANDSTTGRPSTLIGNTGNIVNTAATAVSGALAANKNIGPGGTDGGKQVWFCFNNGDSTAIFVGPDRSSGSQASTIGSSALGDIISGNQAIQGIYCQSAACNGGSSTLGTWPATLAGSTWTFEYGPTSGVFGPSVAYQVVP